MCVDPAGAGRIGSNRWEPGHEPKSGESSGYWTHCNDNSGMEWNVDLDQQSSWSMNP